MENQQIILGAKEAIHHFSKKYNFGWVNFITKDGDGYVSLWNHKPVYNLANNEWRPGFTENNEYLKALINENLKVVNTFHKLLKLECYDPEEFERGIHDVHIIEFLSDKPWQMIMSR